MSRRTSFDLTERRAATALVADMRSRRSPTLQIAVAPVGTDAWFYRTRAGAEIDLLLLLPDQRLWAVEVTRSAVRKTSRGFEVAANDLDVAERFVVHPGDAEYPLSEHTTALPLDALMARLASAP